jgi:hypothetical protein
MKGNIIYKVPNLGFSEASNLEKTKASNLGYELSLENGIMDLIIANSVLFE